MCGIDLACGEIHLIWVKCSWRIAIGINVWLNVDHSFFIPWYQYDFHKPSNLYTNAVENVMEMLYGFPNDS